VGFLYGPLLVGLTSSTIKIYVKHLKTPMSQDMNSPVQTTVKKGKQLFEESQALVQGL